MGFESTQDSEEDASVPLPEAEDEQILHEEFEKELAQHGVTIETPRSFPEVPIDYRAFGDLEADMRNDVEWLKEYLKGPYVYDSFGNGSVNNMARRDFERGLEQNYGNMFGEEIRRINHGNKFSRTNLQLVLGKPILICYTLQEDPVYDVLRFEIEDLFEKFPPISDLEVVAEGGDYVKYKEKLEQVEDVVYEIVQAIARYTNKQQQGS
jgi:hypothetical protein